MALSVNARNLDVSKISFVQGIAKQGRNPPINMKYGDDDKNKQFFQILLPKSGVRLLTRVDEKTGNTSYTLSYTLTGCDNYGRDRADESTEMGKLYNSLKDLEEVVIKAAVDNSAKWFGKKRSEETIRDSFNKIIRVSSDKFDGESVPNGKYPPSWWIKVPVYENQVKVDNEGIVDNRGNPIDEVTPQRLLTIFPNNCQAKLIVTGSVYVIAGGGFGVTWKLKGAQVFPSSKVRAAELFAADGGDEEEGTTQQEEEQHSEQVTQQVVEETPQQTVSQTSAPARKKRSAVGQ